MNNIILCWLQSNYGGVKGRVTYEARHMDAATEEPSEFDSPKRLSNNDTDKENTDEENAVKQTKTPERRKGEKSEDDDDEDEEQVRIGTEILLII